MRKILAISGSHRKGNTEWLLKTLLDEVRKQGAKTDLVLLRRKQIKVCDGCLTCDKLKKCHLEDDMRGIYHKLLESDVIVLGTPVYFDNVSGMMKNFIDRLNPTCEELAGKHLATVVVGQLKGKAGIQSRKKVVMYMQGLSQIFGMKYVGAVSTRGREAGEVSTNTTIQKECWKLGRRII